MCICVYTCTFVYMYIHVQCIYKYMYVISQEVMLKVCVHVHVHVCVCAGILNCTSYPIIAPSSNVQKAYLLVPWCAVWWHMYMYVCSTFYRVCAFAKSIPPVLCCAVWCVVCLVAVWRSRRGGWDVPNTTWPGCSTPCWWTPTSLTDPIRTRWETGQIRTSQIRTRWESFWRLSLPFSQSLREFVCVWVCVLAACLLGIEVCVCVCVQVVSGGEASLWPGGLCEEG